MGRREDLQHERVVLAAEATRLTYQPSSREVVEAERAIRDRLLEIEGELSPGLPARRSGITPAQAVLHLRARGRLV